MSAKLLDGLEMFLGVFVTSLNSSNLQMAGGCHIYRPPSRGAVAPTVSKILRTIGWTDASAWGSVGSSGHSQTRSSHWASDALSATPPV